MKKIVILGSGPGGYTAAVRAAQLGWNVTVVERDGIGGVCLQHGCIPVKTLVQSARVYESAMNAAEFGVTCENTTFDFARMMARKNDVISVNERGIGALLKKNNVKIVHGAGILFSPKKIAVTDADGSVSILDADRTIIATGSSTVMPPFIPSGRDNIFDCEGALALESLPKSIMILGGGVLGCEFASLFGTLGVDVTIIEMAQYLLPAFDRDLSKRLTVSLRKRSINVLTGNAVASVEADDSTGKVRATLSDSQLIEADACLVALGRTPNIGNIGLEDTNIELWREKFSGIKVDDFMQTSVPGVYAVGDVTGMRMLAHVASAQAITAAEHACGADTQPVNYDAVPDCCWGTPEIATVGITEAEALASRINIMASTYHYRSLGISHVTGDTDGIVKVIADKDSDIVVGIHIYGANATELIAEATVVVANELTVSDVKATIHAHPTRAEIIKESILAVRNENIHE